MIIHLYKNCFTVMHILFRVLFLFLLHYLSKILIIRKSETQTIENQQIIYRKMLTFSNSLSKITFCLVFIVTLFYCRSIKTAKKFNNFLLFFSALKNQITKVIISNSKILILLHKNIIKDNTS